MTSREERGSGLTDGDRWIANNLRGRESRRDIGEIISEARARGLEVSWRIITFLSDRVWGWAGFAPPNYVCDFLAEFLGSSDRAALDPHSGYGTLLLSLVQSGAVRRGTGIEPHEDAVQVAKVLDASNSVEWIVGDALE